MKLSASERVILRSEIDVGVSVASLWELSIKWAIGRLEIPGRRGPIPPDHFAKSATAIGLPILPVEPAEAEYVRQLPRIHGDPFDRLLIAQALLNGRIIMTRDAVFARYPGVQIHA